MQPVLKSIPAWARKPIHNFRKQQTAPFDNAVKHPISSQDSIYVEAAASEVWEELADVNDTAQDKNKHHQFVEAEIPGFGQVDAHFHEKPNETEVGASLDNGQTAYFFHQQEDSTQMVTLSQNGESKAVFIDRQTPENSYILLQG